jgi:hypothetical protein
MATVSATEATSIKKSSVDSKFPVLLPEYLVLHVSDEEFDSYINASLVAAEPPVEHLTGTEDRVAQLDLDKEHVSSEAPSIGAGSGSAFMNALNTATATQKESGESLPENMMYTENMGIAHESTTSPLLDLFSELEKTITRDRLKRLLDSAWKEDPLATLKIIWNARSIHLGKGEQESFYRCLGWLKDKHPKTLLVNLPSIVRPTIEKTVKKEDNDSAVLIDVEDLSGEDEFSVLHGGAHGYWKDLLNILVLAVDNKLDVLVAPRDILHVHNVQKAQKHPADRTKRKYDEMVEFNIKQKQVAKERKHDLENLRHKNTVNMLKENPFYRALHLTVARLFARQLKRDSELLKSGKQEHLSRLSLAAKWAPSLQGFHDKHTFIASTISEAIYPPSTFPENIESREMYIKRAREEFRRLTLAPLRKALEVVEQNISACTFTKINYSKVPSLAMDNYKNLFVKKDIDRFEKYIERVAEGKSRISGAVLMPATLVHQARGAVGHDIMHAAGDDEKAKEVKSADKLLKDKMAQILNKVVDGQWNSLVQRVKDNGKLSSSIAVCDVSGSMGYPVFPDKTVPMDSAIGLSLLLAEITEPPFGGSIITFSADPQVCKVGGSEDKRSFTEKVKCLMSADWGMNTDFVAVFERLVLPMAVKNKLKPEDMVKQVFVFSDMQFDSAEESGKDQFETSYQRIERKYAEAGYKVPKLIFWNLASGGGRYDEESEDEEVVAPKPVTKDTTNTLLVSGYSQAMMKMFLDEGQFGEDEEEVVEEEGEKTEGDEFVTVTKKKKKVDPMAGMWKAIGHKAYGMLKVVD